MFYIFFIACFKESVTAPKRRRRSSAGRCLGWALGKGCPALARLPAASPSSSPGRRPKPPAWVPPSRQDRKSVSFPLSLQTKCCQWQPGSCSLLVMDYTTPNEFTYVVLTPKRKATGRPCADQDISSRLAKTIHHRVIEEYGNIFLLNILFQLRL